MQAPPSPIILQPRRAAARSQRGLSLIEILVVLAIIALISGGVAIMAHRAWVRSQYQGARKDIAELSQAVEMYRLELGRCPNAIQDLVEAGVITKLRTDPWGSDYVFACPGEHEEFDIASAGKDKELGTEDDVNSWDIEPQRDVEAR